MKEGLFLDGCCDTPPYCTVEAWPVCLWNITDTRTPRTVPRRRLTLYEAFRSTSCVVMLEGKHKASMDPVVWPSLPKPPRCNHAESLARWVMICQERGSPSLIHNRMFCESYRHPGFLPRTLNSPHFYPAMESRRQTDLEPRWIRRYCAYRRKFSLSLSLSFILHSSTP